MAAESVAIEGCDSNSPIQREHSRLVTIQVKFHELCDNKGPTITIYKSKADMVFGGFTQQSWDSYTGYYKNDEKAFIYSIDRKQIYRVVDAENAIFCHSNWGPSFG
jgi:hypothetical protein